MGILQGFFMSNISYKELDSLIHSIPNVFRKNGAYNGAALNSKKNKHIIDLVKEHTQFLKDNVKLAERIYCIVNELYEYPDCACGGKITLFYNEGGRKEYAEFCSRSCSAKKEANSKANTGKTFSEASKQKQRNTLLEKYGVDNYFKLPEFIESNYNAELVAKRDANRIIAVNEKYGVDNVFQLDIVKNKIEKTNIRKYGVSNYTQKDFSEYTAFILNSKKELSELNLKYNVAYIAKLLEVDSTTVTSYFTKHDIQAINHNESACEIIVREILDEANVQYEQNYTKLLGGRKHVDFYIPSANLAIECNGLYWHSEAIRSDVNFHQNKYELCQEQGVHLIQFWETDLYNNTQVIRSFIRNKLGMSDIIYARKCTIKKISATDASVFVTANHLQPLKPNTIHSAYGLYYNDNLVSVMTFKNKVDSILTRFCTLLNTVVVGGFTKLFKHAINNDNYKTITSYSDCMYSTGALYNSNGFIDVSTNNSVTYYYTHNFTQLLDKREFRKERIKRNYPMQYSNNLTERQLTSIIGVTRINACVIKTWKYIV